MGASLALQSEASEVNNFLFGNIKEETPINMKQSMESTPGFITSLSAREIENGHFEQLTEILRYIPGFKVLKKDGAEYLVSYHDSHAMRLQLLINGRAQHVGALSFNVYHLLPVPVSEIERINVYRSPAAARFGGNSFNAVIDIITKTPLTATPMISVNAEGARLLEGHATAHKEFGRSALSSAVRYTKDRGYDEQLGPQGDWMEETTETESVAVMLTHRWANESSRLSTDVHLGTHTRDNFFVVQNERPVNQKVERYSIGTTYEKTLGKAAHRFQVDLQNYINHESFLSIGPKWYLWPEAAALYAQNPDYFWTFFSGREHLAGGTQEDDAARDAFFARLLTDQGALDPVVAELNHDYDDVFGRVGYSSTWYISPHFKTLFGLSYEKRENYSETFLGGRASSDTFTHHLYSELSNGKWTVNVGYNLEHLSTVSEGAFFSPLVGISYSIDDSSTFKILAARANRNPDLVYTRPRWQYTAANLSEPVDGRTTVPSPIFTPYRTANPTSEKNSSIQMIYLHQGENLLAEAGFYWEEKKDLISDQFEYFRFNANNNGTIRSTGFESSLTLDVSVNSKLKVSINYGDHEANILYEEAAFASWTGYVQQLISYGSHSYALRLGAVDYRHIKNDVFGEASVRRTFGQLTLGTEIAYSDTLAHEVTYHDLMRDSLIYDRKRNHHAFRLGVSAKLMY